MEESTTYQGLIRKGEQLGAIKEAKNILLLLGEDHFKSIPSKKAEAALARITDLKTLEQLTRRVHKTETWEELLGLPERRR